jgi:RHS repeat-associated protein
MTVDKSGALMDNASTGSIYEGVVRHDNLPFGEPLGNGVGIRSVSIGYSDDSVRQKFTGKERDNETGLDFFEARYFSSTQGRFTSPDEFAGGPVELFYFATDASVNPTFYADLTNPQSLNKYQYTYNNPLRYTDPTGHCPPCDQISQRVTLYIAEKIASGISPETRQNIERAGAFVTEYGKGLAKSAANAVIEMGNAGAVITGEAPTALYVPSNGIQSGAMASGDKMLLLGGALGGRVPANVAVAEGEGAAVLSPKVQSIVQEIKSQNITVTVNPRNAQTAQEGNVTLQSGNTSVNLRVETHPLKTNGPPVRHANVEVTKRVKNKNKVIENTHIEQ